MSQFSGFDAERVKSAIGRHERLRDAFIAAQAGEISVQQRYEEQVITAAMDEVLPEESYLLHFGERSLASSSGAAEKIADAEDKFDATAQERFGQIGGFSLLSCFRLDAPEIHQLSVSDGNNRDAHTVISLAITEDETLTISKYSHIVMESPGGGIRSVKLELEVTEEDGVVIDEAVRRLEIIHLDS